MTDPPIPLTARETARRRVLEALRRQGPMARVELGQELGLSAATVSDLTAGLVEDGILVVDGGGEPAALIRGRPKTRLTFAADLGAVIGAWTGFNRIELRLVDSAGVSRATRRLELPLRDLAPEALVGTLAAAIETFRDDHPGAPPVRPWASRFRAMSTPGRA